MILKTSFGSQTASDFRVEYNGKVFHFYKSKDGESIEIKMIDKINHGIEIKVVPVSSNVIKITYKGCETLSDNVLRLSDVFKRSEKCV